MLTEELRKNYWLLDPYLRAKSWYDRTGVVSDGGRIDLNAKALPVKSAPVPAPTPPQPQAVVETSNDDLD